MRYQAVLLVGLELFAGGALAQSASPSPPPPPSSTLSDSWAAQPAHSGTAGYRSDAMPSNTSGGHFKFKDRKTTMPGDPPPTAVPADKAPIMGQSMIGPDGRPPVSCPETPQDPKCH